MRIAFLNPSGQIGGAERILLDVMASLRARVPDWDLHLVLGEEGPLIDESKAIGVRPHLCVLPKGLASLGDAPTSARIARSRKILPLFKLVQYTPSIYRHGRQLKSLLTRIQPDIIHTNGLKMHILAASLQMSPIVWHIHDYVSSRPIARRLLSLYARRCSFVIANSRSVEEDLKKVLNKHTRIQTIRNAVNLNRFHPSGELMDLDQLAEMNPAGDDTVRIGLLSTFGLWKGHEIFLKALALIPEDLKYRGYIIGGPTYQTKGSQWNFDDLEVLRDKNGLRGKVGFTGFVHDPDSAIRSLDIVVHASTQPEPFGLVIAETMACARAVIVSEEGGAAEIIDRDVNALSYPPRDVHSLAEQIVILIRNPELRKKLGQAGRATAEKLFDRSRFATELIPVYEEIIRQPHAISPH